jgi:serine/threonine protein kinase
MLGGNTEAYWPSRIKNYEIGEELGHGAFSHVCRCTNLLTGRLFAMKIFPKANLETFGDQERFQREINTMAYLKHESVLALYDFFWDDQNFYLLTDLASGGDLYSYLVQHTRVDEPTAVIIFRQIVNAIAYCHSYAVAHRDLKPENILITEFPHIKVADFGLCGFIRPDQLLRTACGSPCYCSPECLTHPQYDGRKSDVWSLGVVLYTLVTGQVPWNVCNVSFMLRQIVKGVYIVPSYVSPLCKDLITSMINPDLGERLSIDQILEHPWLNQDKPAAPRKLSKLLLSALPPLKPSISIEEITEASARSSTSSDNGIFSPFDEAQSCRTSGLPKLVANPVSSTQKVQQRTKSSSRVAITGNLLTLVQNRQRSAGSLVRLKVAEPKPTELDAISEI